MCVLSALSRLRNQIHALEEAQVRQAIKQKVCNEEKLHHCQKSIGFRSISILFVSG